MQKKLAFAHELADAAKQVTLAHFRQKVEVNFKSDASPVTVADKTCEATLRGLIEKKYPDHGIIGEEQSAKITSSDWQWILDPIDGTRNFISGMPLYGTLIALLRAGKPVLSIVDVPALDERWSATAKMPTHCNNMTVTTRNITELNQAIVGWTSPDIFSASEKPLVERIYQQARQATLNGDCYLYARLASGDIDVVFESGLKPFDYMALILVVQQAGGVITDWQGNALTLENYAQTGGQVLAAANTTLHKQVLDLIRL